MSGFVSDSLKSDFTILRAHMMKKHMIKKSDSTQIATMMDSTFSNMLKIDICFTAVRKGNCAR
jgi:hypothetical protein